MVGGPSVAMPGAPPRWAAWALDLAARYRVPAADLGRAGRGFTTVQARENPSPGYCSGWSAWVRRLGGASVRGVQTPGLFELVLEDDDAAGGLNRGALVDELAGAGGDAQLVAGVAAVAARGV